MIPFKWWYDTFYFGVPYFYFVLEFKSQNSKAIDLVGFVGCVVLNDVAKAF